MLPSHSESEHAYGYSVQFDLRPSYQEVEDNSTKVVCFSIVLSPVGRTLLFIMQYLLYTSKHKRAMHYRETHSLMKDY